MNLGHWYYLHTNGELIHKRTLPESDSPFVQKVWKLDLEDRMSAWILCVEALTLGAKRERIDELAAMWGIIDADAPNFVESTQSLDKNALKLFRDGDAWCATFIDFKNIQESQCGFGETALEAFAELAKQGLLQPYNKQSQRKGGEFMNIELVTKEDKVIAITNDGVTIVRLGTDDMLIEQTDSIAVIETTAKSKGEVVGTDRYTALIDIPEVRADQLELLEMAAAQAKVRCKNAVRAPGGGLSSTQKGILSALKETNPEKFAAFLKSCEDEIDLADDDTPDPEEDSQE